MSLLEFFQTLEYSALLVEMRGSAWLFPAIAGAHLLGLTVLGGAVLVVDLRLLEVGLSRQPVTTVARDAEPWFLGSLAAMVFTGILLFMCFATKYYYLPAFWVKLASLVLVLSLTWSVRRRAIAADAINPSPIRRKLVALISLSLWTSVILAGRLIGFP